MKLSRLALAASCVVALSWIVAAQTPAREGKWEITMQMDIPGMPMKLPATKVTQCLTKEDLADPSRSAPKGPKDKNSDCQVSDHKVVGNKVTWTMVCKGKDAMTGNGEIVYAADSYDGWMKMKTAESEMTMKYSGKRVGDCTK